MGAGPLLRGSIASARARGNRHIKISLYGRAAGSPSLFSRGTYVHACGFLAMDSHNIPAFDTAMNISVIDGEVVLMGPDGLCASFTVEAAREFAKRIIAAIDEVGEDHRSN